MLKWAGFLLAGLMMACASQHPVLPEPAEPEPEVSWQVVEESRMVGGELKRQIIQNMEREMRVLLGWSITQFDDIQQRMRRELDDLTPPPKIQAVERELADYYQEEDDVYEARVEEVTERYKKELDEVLAIVRPKVWDVAFAVTEAVDMGYCEEHSTGIPEVDEIAEATLDLIDFRSGADDIDDQGQHAKYIRLFMDRIYKNEIEDQGRFSLFVSDPIRHYFRKDEDAIGVTVTYQRKGLDPDIPLELRQVVRNRIVRGGTTQFCMDYTPDYNLGNEAGQMRLARANKGGLVVVSEVFYPRVNMDHPYFDRLRDFTAIRDYKTAVVNADTGEILDSVAWQYLWHISHLGAVAVEKGFTPFADEQAREIKALITKEQQR